MNSPAGADPMEGLRPLRPLTRQRLAPFETLAVLNRAVTAFCYQADFKGLASSVPNQATLINDLFMHPHTTVEFVGRDLKVPRVAATKCLKTPAGAGLVQKVKVGRSNCCINLALNSIFAGVANIEGQPT